MDSKLINFLRNTLRRASYRWKTRGEAEKRFRRPMGTYKNGRVKYGYACAECDVIGQKKDRQLDHIHPVIGPEGFQTLDKMAERMYCPQENWAMLCYPHHLAKTKTETEGRKLYRHANEEQRKELVRLAWEREELLIEKYRKKYP